MKNQLYKTFLLTLIVVGALLGLFYMPRLAIGDTLLRRVNILSDIQQRDSTGRNLAESAADEAEGIREEVLDQSKVAVAEIEVEDSVPEGMVAIEDFGSQDGGTRIMDHFYAALREAKNRPVRVAYFGDSFVEGDILTSELRDLLQTAYGGNGVGWVDMASIVAGFRTTVTHSARGWSDHNANDQGGYNSKLAGLAGRYYLPASTGTTTLTCQRRLYPDHLSKADQATVFFTPGSTLSIAARVDDGEMQTIYGSGNVPAQTEPVYVTKLVPTDSVDEFGDTVMKEVRVKQETAAPVADASANASTQVMAETLHGPLSSISVSAHGNGRLYGIALDGSHGLCVDNFAMRSGNGWFLRDLPMETLRQFASVRPYDLIILHYGLNIANRKSKDYSYYTNRMAESIEHLRQAFPSASILVISVSDRGQRGSDGQIHTMPGVTELMQFQRKMASDAHVAFWNLYEAMGGDGSIARMKEEKEANLDFTHINFKGGTRLARTLFDVLQNGMENYDRRH